MAIAFRKKTDIEEIKKYDSALLEAIQPAGGISFSSEKYISTGDGYEACISIYKFPATIRKFWLHYLTNIPDSIVTMDVQTYDTAEVKKNLNKSIKEQIVRANTMKEPGTRIEAQQKAEELAAMQEELRVMGEIVKNIIIRIFLFAPTKDELEKLVKDQVAELASDDYKCAVFLNEGKHSWRSMYQSYTKQSISEYSRPGQPIRSTVLANGYPFHYSSLMDSRGAYYGDTTSADGNVLLDLFRITERRMSYNAAVFGNMGAGKSTLLKKIMADRAIRGDYVRVFDGTGEFSNLANYLGGQVLSLDGSDGMINMYEILDAGDNDNLSYQRHISKLGINFKFWLPDATNNLISQYKNLCRSMYEKMGILDENGLRHKLNNLNSKDYPILQDLVNLIAEEKDQLYDGKKRITEAEVQLNVQALTAIEVVLKEKLNSFNHIFNGHTSIPDILKEQILVFNTKNLLTYSPDVINSQLFSFLSLGWDNCIKIGAEMKYLYDKKKIDQWDIKHFLIIIDEAHRIINSSTPDAVQQINIFARESRKYFGGIIMASQSIRDYIPDGSSTEAEQMIKALFEFSTYKFVMTQDSNTIQKLQDVFKDSLTESEVRRIPRLRKGECILSMPDQNIQFKVDLSPEEESLFQGGA